MHIPDGFLSTPVWAALDGAAIPALGLLIRRAQAGFQESRIPLLGVMGAFVFAAQMINFPVGIGTSGHLVGGALLACTLGPAAASVVMAAILSLQALVFQDGGVLALGANMINMAVVGVLAGYLPYYFWGRGRGRRAAIFAGGFFSVLCSALLALSELLISGVGMPKGAIWASIALFGVSAALEGAITVAVVQAIEAIQPGFVQVPSGKRSPALAALGMAAILLAGVGVLFASTEPDGIQQILATAAGGDSSWIQKAAAGLGGLATIYLLCLAAGRFVLRKRSA